MFISEIQLNLIRCGVLSGTPVSAEPTSYESANDMWSYKSSKSVEAARVLSDFVLFFGYADDVALGYEISLENKQQPR